MFFKSHKKTENVIREKKKNITSVLENLNKQNCYFNSK